VKSPEKQLLPLEIRLHNRSFISPNRVPKFNSTSMEVELRKIEGNGVELR